MLNTEIVWQSLFCSQRLNYGGNGHEEKANLKINCPENILTVFMMYFN